MPIVTIIIATYNSSKTLYGALKSVISQKFQDWECIIVDGASTDNTIDIVKGFALKDYRFRYISEPDKGIYDAFNKGWKTAKGEWIYYLGSDDALTVNGLNELVNSSFGADIVYGDIIFLTKNGKKYKSSIPVEKLKGRMVCHQALIMKRSIISELGGFDLTYKIGADFDLFQKALAYGKKFIYKPVYVAYFNSFGTSGIGVEILKETFRIRKKYHTNSSLIIIYKYFKFWIKRTLKKIFLK